MSNSATRVPPLRQHCSAMQSIATLATALRKHIPAAPAPLPEQLLAPSDFFNNDDKELRISVKAAGCTTRTTVSIWMTEDETAPPSEPSSLANYVSTTSPPPGWTWDFSAKRWTLSAVADFAQTQTVPLPPIDRIGLPPADHEIHILAIGQVGRGQAPQKVKAVARVRVIPRPNLLRIESGNPQIVEGAGATSTSSPAAPLIAGVYRHFGNPLELDTQHLVPIEGQTVRFTVGDLFYGALLHAGSPQSVVTASTDVHGLATAAVRILKSVYRDDLRLSVDTTNLVTSGRVVTETYKSTIQAVLVDSDGVTLTQIVSAGV